MRQPSRDHRQRRRLIAAGLLACLLVAAGIVAISSSAIAAAPSPGIASAVATAVPSVDLRSSGQGAGAAGNPLGAVQAVVVVVALGLAAALATLAYIKFGPDRSAAGRGIDSDGSGPGR